MTKIKLSLTVSQLADVANCVDVALRQGLAYGMVTRQEGALLVGNRRRLLKKLEEELERVAPASPSAVLSLGRGKR